MVSNYRAVIVDDEELARVSLKDVLRSFPEVEIVGEADSVYSALEVIDSVKPDLIFLDIQMSGESGFDLLDKIENSIKIIFVTAYDKHAIRAFDVNAHDYLLKPVNRERMRQSIDKLDEFQGKDEVVQKKLDYDDMVFINTNNKCRFLKINTITAITSNADYTNLFITDKSKLIVKKTMKEWEYRLSEKDFVRIHRETIINVNYIQSIEEWFNYSYKIKMEGIEKPLVLSKRYVQKIKSLKGL